MVETSPVESVDRALRMLTTLAGAGARGMTLAELATALDLNKTTVHRGLAALKHRDFVTQDPTSGAYLLGGAATDLARTYFGEDNLPGLLHPALVALCAATDELVHLGTLNGVQVVYLDKVEPERPVRVWSAVGRRRPAVTTALGRALLAHRATEAEPLDEAALAGYVPAGVEVDPGRLRAMLESARVTGYATEEQENEPGISCVAVPLMRAGAAVAAVSITAPSERMTPDRITELHTAIRRTLPPLLPPGLTLPHPAPRGDRSRA